MFAVFLWCKMSLLALGDAIGLSFEWLLSEGSGHSQPDPVICAVAFDPFRKSSTRTAMRNANSTVFAERNKGWN
jgi:hypothetical protein